MALVQEEPRTPIFRVMSSPEGANNALDGTINFIDETGLENPHSANSVAASTTPPTSQVPRETINFIEEPAPAGANGDAAAGDSTAKSSNTSISYNILEVASSAARPDKAAAPSTSTLHQPSVTVAEKKEQKIKKTGDTTTTTISATKGTPLSRHTAAKPASNPPSTNTTNLKTTLGSARTSNAKAAIPQPPKVSHRAKVAESKPHPSPPPSAAPRTRTTASRNHRIVLPPLPQQPQEAQQQAEVAPANKEPQPAQAAVLPAPQPVEEEKKISTTQDTTTTTPAAAPIPAATQVKETTTQNAEKDDAASEYSEAGEKEDEVALGAAAEKKATQLPGKIAAAAALAAVQHANEQDLLPSDHTCVLPGTQWEVILQHSRMAVDRTIVAEAAAATGLGPEYIRVTDLTATAKGLEAKLRIAHDPTVLSNAKVDELLSQCTFENTLLLHTLRTTKGPATNDTTGGAAEAETMPPAPVIVAVTSDAASDAESEAAHEANAKKEEEKKEEEEEKSEPQPAEQHEEAAAGRSATRLSLRPATIESPVYSFTRRIGNRRTGGHLSIRYAAGPFEPKQRLEFYFAAAPSHITGHFVRSCLAAQLRVRPQRLQLRCNAFDVHDDTTGAELHWHSGTILDAILLQPRSNTAASHSHTALSESRPQTKLTDTAAPATEINNVAKKEEGKDENVYRASLKQHRSAEEQRRWIEHLTTPTVSTQAKRVEKVNIEHEENTKSARPRRARSTSPRMRSHAPHRENTTTKGNMREEGGYTRQGRLVATARQPRRSKSNPSVPSLALPHYTAQQQQNNNEEVMGAHPGYLTPTESSRRKRTILIEWERELPSELTVQRTYSVRTPRTAKEPAPLLLPPPQPNEPRRSSAQTSRSHSRRLRSRTNSTPYPSTANHTTSTNMVNVYYNTNTNSATVTRSHSRREGSRRSNGLNGSHTSRLSSHMNTTTTTFVHQVEPPQRVLRNVPATSLTLLLLRRGVRPVMNAQHQQQDPLSTQQGINHHHHSATTMSQNKAAYGIGAAPLRLTPTERVGETRSVSRRSHSPHRQFPAAAATHNNTAHHNNNTQQEEQREQYEQELNGNAAETFHTMNKAMPQTSYLHAVGEAYVEADEPAPERHAPNPTR